MGGIHIDSFFFSPSATLLCTSFSDMTSARRERNKRSGQTKEQSAEKAAEDAPQVKSVCVLQC